MALLLAACVDDGPGAAGPPSPAPGTLAATVATTANGTDPSMPSASSVPIGVDGCGETPVRSDEPLPGWATDANLATGRFVLSAEGNVLGYLFVDPLRVAPRDDGMSNKVLWVVREPRNGDDLTWTATSGDDVVHGSLPADSGPGEIYPSIIDVPAPGCWHVTLGWDGNVGHVDLRYVS